MPNPPAWHGKDGLLYMSQVKGGPLTAVALLSEWSLDMATDKIETTALTDTNKTYVQGLRDTKGTLTGFWNSLDDTMFDAAESKTGVDILIYPTIVTTTTSFAGPAWLDVSIKGGVNAAVTIEGTFTANGAWTRVGQP